MKEAVKRECSLFCWKDLPEESVTDRLSRKLITGDRIMVAHVMLKKGCVVPTHSHENEQISYTLRGAIKFDTGGKEIILREALVFPDFGSGWSSDPPNR